MLFHYIGGGGVTLNVFIIICQVRLDFLLTRASFSHLVTLWRLCCVLIHLMSVNLWKLFETDSSNSERALSSLFLDTHYIMRHRDRYDQYKELLLQENMEVVKHTKILHPSVEDYFENFDGSQYLPRPWLRSIYSRD